VATFVLPAAIGYATFRICRDLRDRDPRPIAQPPRSRVRRNAAGGYDADHHPEEPASADAGVGGKEGSSP
jgi:hypothetical protein